MIKPSAFKTAQYTKPICYWHTWAANKWRP